MKLPSDPKEKIKILILIGIGAVAVIFMLVSLVVKPLRARRQANTEEIAKVKELVDAAQRDVSRMMQDRDKNTHVLEDIVEKIYQQGYILQPRLGNYELGAREYVESIAASQGIPIESAREVGLTQIPVATGQKDERALKCYTLRVTLRAGMPQLVRFLKAIEAGNPYLCVSSIGITPRTEDPAQHQVSLDVQWPVWADPATGRNLEQRLDEARSFVPASS
ncbi:MAG: type II secretion system protein M [Lentisphaerae bacterium]|nr:type II secretion system protein M [Lentisphaerota bacterium]